MAIMKMTHRNSYSILFPFSLITIHTRYSNILYYFSFLRSIYLRLQIFIDNHNIQTVIYFTCYRPLKKAFTVPYVVSLTIPNNLFMNVVWLTQEKSQWTLPVSVKALFITICRYNVWQVVSILVRYILEFSFQLQ